jgi:hypothetical protein
MTSEKVLYTDGHEVTVTDTFFKVKNSLYQLKGITHHTLLIVHPRRVAPFMILLIGIILIILGAMHLVPNSLIPGFEPLSISVTSARSFQVSLNTAAIAVGSLIVLISLLVLQMLKDRYAIRIATAEGEKNVIVSPRKEYISQILDALNKAFLNLIPASRKTRK